ncbi:MAG: SpoVR family protein [Deltaproteobacteria bacterium]|nr:SpoVR family protein [Deltaproteobacteria bacterium]
MKDEIRYWIKQIAGYARGFGLDFFETRFEMVDYDKMNELAAYGGFPGRYPHWRFGMEYERLRKSYSYGLHKIYEMVINNDPCYAYLLDENSMIDHKIVIAHVYAHSDFFKNNAWFEPSNRKMMDELANHGARIRRYMEQYGIDRVENFIDACLSIENLIDFHSPYIVRTKPEKKGDEPEKIADVPRIKSKKYLEDYINPKEYIEAEKKKLEEEMSRKKKFPEAPERDILRFLVENAPLEAWERSVLSMVREEAYYFAPQRMTKILNEGWAAYWHSKIMTEKALADSEVLEYADHHSGTLATSPGQLNPYKIGIELLRDIEERWNKGKFGKEYDECADISAKEKWNRNLGLGRKKLFEARRIHNDLTFLDSFLTPEFAMAQKLFAFEFNPQTDRYEIVSREFQKVKDKLLFSLTNLGEPAIDIEDANYMNRGELYMVHRHEGIDLRKDWAVDTLKNVGSIWKRPVRLGTKFGGSAVLFTHDGANFREEQV